MFFKLLIFTAALEFGFLNGGVFNYSPRNYEWTEIGALYATLEGRASLGPISVGGSVQTHFTPQTITNYVPFQATYIFDAKVKAGNVEIGYEHSCFHPIQPMLS